ncbi:TetR/AcrR family transcriptional regulator [Nocardia sp. NPDC003979]
MPRSVDRPERLSAISDAVVAIATEHGFAAVTIRSVAERIGASTSLVTHYVGHRDDILRLAVRRVVEARCREADRTIAGAVGTVALRTLVEWAILTTAEDHGIHRFWLALVVGSADEPALREELDVFNNWWDTRLRHALAATGRTDTDQAADLINVIVDGLIIGAFDNGHPWPPERRRRILTATWSMLGLAPREEWL